MFPLCDTVKIVDPMIANIELVAFVYVLIPLFCKFCVYVFHLVIVKLFAKFAFEHCTLYPLFGFCLHSLLGNSVGILQLYFFYHITD